ncbi:MAG: hypothetical protein NDP13_03005 [Crenarchaeota archaeon]|nr:hypothetical protein [Thermoproteota archaeon]MCR8455238.1 hypothetical protein [Thermoproteota archaeon]MCR8486867.1 hypothetical protein [Thermoproteota archaeon]
MSAQQAWIEYRPDIPEEVLHELADFFREHKGFVNEDIKRFISDTDSFMRKGSYFIVNLKEFSAWASKEPPARYSSKTIIVDRLTFYVPYHFDNENHGIYFRAMKLLEDFVEIASIFQEVLKTTKFIRALSGGSEALTLRLLGIRKNLKSLVNSLFIEFIVFLYAHSVAHRILEDISYSIECICKAGRFLYKMKYSILNSKDEEGLCYYAAFNALRRYMPGVLKRSKKAERLSNIFFPIISEFSWGSIVSINFASTAILYVYYVLNKRIPSASVRKDIYDRLSMLFNIFWKLYYTYEEDIGPPNVKPITQRVFLTFI